MSLSARELVLIMRARDEASRAIRQVGGSINEMGNTSKTAADKMASLGGAMLTLGAGMAGIGAVGTGFFNSATDDAIDYTEAASRALTQAGDVGASLEQLKDIGKRVGAEVPVAFETIQDGLFDIFSTIDTTLPGAEEILTELSRAAVAGSADLSAVSRTSLAVMNAWGMTEEDITRILDLQFKMVEKGVGTYDEFAQSIGRAIPAAVAADQNFEQLTGTMAFLTRNGLTTSQATTSAARALELLTTPKVVGKLEALGVVVRDNEGNFKAMNDIVTDLAVNQGWAQLTGPDRKAAFKEIFGTGSIQARRFFDVAIPNFEDLNSLVDVMAGSEGALDTAYGIMFETPAAQAQQLKNNYAILKTEIGDELIPAKMALLKIVQRLFDWWNSLDEGTRSLIVRIAAAVSAFLLVAGTITAVVGSVLLFIGVVAPAVGGVAALIKIFLAMNVVLALAAVAAFLIYKNWDKVKEFLLPIFTEIRGAFDAFIAGFKNPFDGRTTAGFAGFFEEMGLRLGKAWELVKIVFTEIRGGLRAFWTVFNNPDDGTTSAGFAGALEDFALWLRRSFIPALVDVWNGVKAFWGGLKSFWGWLKENFGGGFREIADSLINAWHGISDEVLQTVDMLVTGTVDSFNFLWPIIKQVMGFIVDVIKVGLDIIIELWRIWGPTIIQFVRIAWDLISTLISAAIDFISAAIRFGLNIMQGDWEGAWAAMKDALSAIWKAIKAIFKAGWDFIKLVFTSGLVAVLKTGAALVAGIRRLFQLMMDRGKAIIKAGVGGIISEFSRLKSRILGIFRNAGSWLYNAGKRILSGLLNGIKDKVGSIKSELSGLTNLIPDWKGPASVDQKLLFKNGQLIMNGLQTGLRDGWGNVRGYLNDLTTEQNFMPTVDTSLTGSSGTNNYALMVAAFKEALETAEVDHAGLKVEGDLILGDEVDVDDLDMWAKKGFAGV